MSCMRRRVHRAPASAYAHRCIPHGLVNGTMGIVHDIMCDEKGSPIAVLLRVKRHQTGADGYSGPSFDAGLPATEFDASTEALVPIAMVTQEKYNGSKTASRTQFPLMLAWAITVSTPRRGTRTSRVHATPLTQLRTPHTCRRVRGCQSHPDRARRSRTGP